MATQTPSADTREASKAQRLVDEILAHVGWTLPNPAVTMGSPGCAEAVVGYFSHEQVRSYAALAVLVERVRLAERIIRDTEAAAKDAHSLASEDIRILRNQK